MAICFIGNSIIDFISHVENEENIAHGTKGEMEIISSEKAKELINNLKNKSIIAGGSSNNSACGLSLLDENVRFIGSVGKDQFSELYLENLRDYFVNTEYMVWDINHSTGISIIYITPDAERTMNTHLGASVNLVPDNITRKALEDIKGSFVEGYIYYSRYGAQIISKLFTETKKIGGFNAISLSDINCVQNFRNEFLNLIDENKIDLLFGNKKEMMHLFKVDDEGSLNFQLKKNSTKYVTLVMTNGKYGCVIAQENEIKIIPAKKIKNIIDTTGAGDLFVSGFLKGYINGRNIIKCSEMGNYYASEIIQTIGGKVNKDSISKIKENFLKF